MNNHLSPWLAEHNKATIHFVVNPGIKAQKCCGVILIGPLL